MWQPAAEFNGDIMFAEPRDGGPQHANFGTDSLNDIIYSNSLTIMPFAEHRSRC